MGIVINSYSYLLIGMLGKGVFGLPKRAVMRGNLGELQDNLNFIVHNGHQALLHLFAQPVQSSTDKRAKKNWAAAMDKSCQKLLRYPDHKHRYLTLYSGTG